MAWHDPEPSLAQRLTRGLRRLGGSMTAFVAALMLVVFVRLLLVAGWGGFNWVPPWVQIAHGANLPAAAADGAWWRSATSIFVHFGLIHFLYTLVALAVVAPMLEELYGRWVGLLLFLVTGMLAALASTYLLGRADVGAGASGAVMGCIGVVAGAGHRSGTKRGQGMRNDILRWSIFVVVLGFMLGADSRGHLGGLIAGGLIGLALRPEWLTGPAVRPLRTGLGVVAVAIALAAVIAAVLPLQSV